jgi:hypothetical protein
MMKSPNLMQKAVTVYIDEKQGFVSKRGELECSKLAPNCKK